MSMQKISEYDAFGPWIYEIDDKHELSPLFMPYKDKFCDAIMTFKVPRKIDRRKANPKMHLYNEVIALFKTHILILKRQRNNVIEYRFDIDDIQAIEKAHFLLKGDLLLYTNDNVFNITYNTVSQDIITKFVSLLRKQQKFNYNKLPLHSLKYDIHTIDYLYVHLIDEIKQNESDVELVAYQPEIDLNPDLKIKNKTKRKRKKRFLPCTAFLSNNRELIIINRDKLIRRYGDYTYSYIYLCIASIENIYIENHPKKENIYLIYLKIGKHKFVFPFNEKNNGIEEFVKIYD